jgi:hypothetical protein
MDNENPLFISISDKLMKFFLSIFISNDLTKIKFYLYSDTMINSQQPYRQVSSSINYGPYGFITALSLSRNLGRCCQILSLSEMLEAAAVLNFSSSSTCAMINSCTGVHLCGNYISSLLMSWLNCLDQN